MSIYNDAIADLQNQIATATRVPPPGLHRSSLSASDEGLSFAFGPERHDTFMDEFAAAMCEPIDRPVARHVEPRASTVLFDQPKTITTITELDWRGRPVVTYRGPGVDKYLHCRPEPRDDWGVLVDAVGRLATAAAPLFAWVAGAVAALWALIVAWWTRPAREAAERAAELVAIRDGALAQAEFAAENGMLVSAAVWEQLAADAEAVS